MLAVMLVFSTLKLRAQSICNVCCPYVHLTGLGNACCSFRDFYSLGFASVDVSWMGWVHNVAK